MNERIPILQMLKEIPLQILDAITDKLYDENTMHSSIISTRTLTISAEEFIRSHLAGVIIRGL